MSEAVYFLTLGLILGTILLVFGMKYFAAARQAQSRILDEGAYRELAQKAAAAQSQSAASLTALQAELSDVKTRLGAVETILKTVE